MTRIAVVTDSSSQITPDLVARHSIEVVPLTVTIDGTDHLEGVDLDADAFYAAFENGRRPEVSTSQPSPGRFLDAYQRLVERGCDRIVSVHIGEAMSGTVGSARIAAQGTAVPVDVIDTGSASFGVAACAWAAAVAAAEGADVPEIRTRIDRLVPSVATAFMVGVPTLTERGGRATEIDLDADDEGDGGVQVLAMVDGRLSVLDRVATVDDTVDVMSAYATSWGGGVTVAIGTADEPSRPLANRLDDALTGLAAIDLVTHYRIGPSIGAHTGPGTFGLFVFPTIEV